MCVLLITRLLREWEVWARKPVNHTSWVAVVTPTDRPKSVPNRCVIEHFCSLVCVVTFPFWHFCWYRGFCRRIESDLYLFLSFRFFSFCFFSFCFISILFVLSLLFSFVLQKKKNLFPILFVFIVLNIPFFSGGGSLQVLEKKIPYSAKYTPIWVFSRKSIPKP